MTLVQSGIADIPNRYKQETQIDEKGEFHFEMVPSNIAQYLVEIEKKNFCWKKARQSIEI